MGSVPGPDQHRDTGTQLPPLPAPVTSWCLCPRSLVALKGPGGESRVVTLSCLFPAPFPHCRDTPGAGQGPSGGRCHLGTAAPADTQQLQPRRAVSSAARWDPCPEGGFNGTLRVRLGSAGLGWHRCHHRASGSQGLTGKLRHGWGVEQLGSRAGCWRAHPMPWQHFSWLWQCQMLQEPKNKRSCWPRLCKSRVPVPPRAGARRVRRQTRPDPGTDPGKCHCPKGRGLSPLLSVPSGQPWGWGGRPWRFGVPMVAP